MPWHELLGPLHRLSEPAAPDDWFAELQSRCSHGSFELAVLGGRLAVTPGYAFLAGYQAALRRLWPAAPTASAHSVPPKTANCFRPTCRPAWTS